MDFFQAEDGIRDCLLSRGLGDVYKRQVQKEIGIEFKLTFERTWSAISRALERSSLEIKDRNRELKYFQVSVDEDDNSFFGFFSRSNNAADVDYELTFTQSGENTILEFKKLSNTSISVNDLVDQLVN